MSEFIGWAVSIVWAIVCVGLLVYFIVDRARLAVPRRHGNS